jgi:hypothetical protein
MASSDMAKRLESCKRDLATVMNSQRLVSLKRDVNTANAFDEVTNLALKWLGRIEPFADRIEDDALIPLAVFVDKIVGVDYCFRVDRRSTLCVCGLGDQLVYPRPDFPTAQRLKLGGRYLRPRGGMHRSVPIVAECQHKLYRPVQ